MPVTPPKPVELYRPKPDGHRWIVDGPGMPTPPKHFYGHFHDAVAAAGQAQMAYDSGRLAGEIFELNRKLEGLNRG